jgi:hypothetical protein
MANHPSAPPGLYFFERLRGFHPAQECQPTRDSGQVNGLDARLRGAGSVGRITGHVPVQGAVAHQEECDVLVVQDIHDMAESLPG